MLSSIGQNFGYGNYGFGNQGQIQGQNGQNGGQNFQGQGSFGIPPQNQQGMGQNFGMQNGMMQNQQNFGMPQNFGNQQGFQGMQFGNQNGFQGQDSFQFQGGMNFNQPFGQQEFMGQGMFGMPQSFQNGGMPQGRMGMLPFGNGFEGQNGQEPPEKLTEDFASSIASYLVEKQGLTEEDAQNAVAELNNNKDIHDPVEAVKQYFQVTDEEEAKTLAAEIFGEPPKMQQDGQRLNLSF